MKRLLIATIILLTATVLVTVVYFRRLNTTAQHTSLVMRAIPDDASLIFEFNNDKEFYDIFSGSKLFINILGEEKQAELEVLRKRIIQNPLLSKYLSGQNIFVSLHPQTGNSIDFLLTMSITKDFHADVLDMLYKQRNNRLLIHTIDIEGKQGYVVYLSDLKKRFYLINKDEHTLSGSFSKEVIANCAKYDYRTAKHSFVLLSDQQSSSSLANLYVNYSGLTSLTGQLFTIKNPDIFKTLRQYQAFGALSLNFNNNALIFNGSSQPQANEDGSYLGLFARQQPVANRLKEIFPSTTAYSSAFAVSDPAKFESDLADLEVKTDIGKDRKSLLNKIKKETGIALQKEFTGLLGSEFAVVTTRYHEKIGLVQIKDGTKLLTLLTNISKMISDNIGQFNYEKLPQILLGDGFFVFKRPYFKVIDNYLVLTNSESELRSYNDTYTNRKFLVNTGGYNDFNNLEAERCNVAFFIQFRNAAQLFKQDMKAAFYDGFSNSDPGLKNFYGASLQFTSSDKSFYTNFCMGLHRDTTAEKDTL